MSRRQRRKSLRQIRSNLRAMGHTTVDQLSDQQLQELAERYGSLEEMALLTNPRSATAIRNLAAVLKPEPSPVPGAPVLSRDDIEKTIGPKSSGTHDDAGELLHLQGGPMHDLLVREGAPVLEASWSSKGQYVRLDLRTHGDSDLDGVPIATWVPS